MKYILFLQRILFLLRIPIYWFIIGNSMCYSLDVWRNCLRHAIGIHVSGVRVEAVASAWSRGLDHLKTFSFGW